MALKDYRSKRDLKLSKEPAAKIAGSKKKEPVFVIQKHEASHLHYDLRLEAAGVLKSWAIPKGFSGEHQKNLAIMVEDHPFAYRNFKGVIPPGNYGAGTVSIWDRGTYFIRDMKTKKAIEKATLDGIKNGKVTFFLRGKKLSGEFALIKIKPRGRENSWLLIKSKGKFSDDYSEKMRENDRKEYIETKLLSAEIKKSGFPDKIEPMLAKLEEAPFDRKGWIFELKLDGYRVLARIIPGKKIGLLSRNQVSLNRNFPEIIKDLGSITMPCVLDGEIVAVKKNGKPDFHALQDHIRTGKGKLIYYVFDILYIENFDLKNRPLIKRKKILKNLVLNYLPDSGHIKYLDHIKDNGLEMFDAVIKSGLEGMVAKDGKSGYEPGRRTGKWLKIKSIKTQEAIIVGLTEPRGSRKYFGSLILAAYDGNELKYIGHSGGGFSDEELRDLKIKLEKFITNKPPIKVPPELKNIRWLKPKIVCQIKFAEWTPDGLMRQPVYMGIRSDKDPRDVKIEK